VRGLPADMVNETACAALDPVYPSPVFVVR